MQNQKKTIMYDFEKDYGDNLYYGPFWDEVIPEIPKPKTKSTFMGYQVNSTIGVPSCGLTATPRYIQLLSRLGFDILTYKSVRSVEWHGNPYPHWRYVKSAVLPVENLAPPTLEALTIPAQDGEPSEVNSFGIHSLRPEYWQQEFEVAQGYLQNGQLLILSLMTSPVPGRTTVEDAKVVAQFGASTSAKVLEINLSCPNTEGGGGLIYDDVALSTNMCIAIKEVIGNKPLLVKVGFYRDQAKLKEFLQKTKGVIDGLSTMNTYVAKVITPDGKEAFPGRAMAGLSGAAIRNIALRQAENTMRFKEELGLDNFTIIGIGGVTKSEHFDLYFKLGVDAVQTAVGAHADPLLAVKYKKKKK